MDHNHAPPTDRELPLQVMVLATQSSILQQPPSPKVNSLVDESA